MSEKQYLENLYGVEYEEDSYYRKEDSTQEKSYLDLRKEIILKDKGFIVKHIIEMINADRIDLSPEFQRNEVWGDNDKKSLFIESILLNIPVPVFYVYETGEGKKLIIDGKQRLSTLRDFHANKFRLTNLKYLKELNSLSYNDITERSPSMVADFEEYECFFYILNHSTPRRYLFDIFMRINTGGMPLNSQEIRNIFAKSNVRDLLKKMVASQEFRNATRERVIDIRMDAQEMALRFISLHKKFNYKEGLLQFKEKNLSDLLENTIVELNNENDLEKYYELFREASNRARDLFGDLAFSRLKKENNVIKTRTGTINKSLFAVTTVLLSDPKYAEVNLRSYSKQVIRDLYLNMEEGLGIIKSLLSSSTNSKNNIEKLFFYMRDIFQESISL
jgi:hypothetical protein